MGYDLTAMAKPHLPEPAGRTQDWEAFCLHTVVQSHSYGEKILSGPKDHSHTMSQAPIITYAKISRTMLGGYVAVHSCPHCKQELKSKEEEIGETDECPGCGGAFVVTEKIKSQILEMRKLKEATKQKKQDEKERLRAEKREQKEREEAERQKRYQELVERGRKKQARMEKERGLPDDETLRQITSEMIVTTAPLIDGYQIVDYLGIDGVEVVTVTDVVTDLVSAIKDEWGFKSSAFESKLRNGRQQALNGLKILAAQKGANAIIGIDFDYSEFSSNRTAIIVTGTMVRIEKRDRSVSPEFMESDH